jgi:hypothetical protein
MGWMGGRLSGLSSRAAEQIKRHPLTWALAWNSMPRLDLFLPHDQSYHGFKHLFRASSVSIPGAGSSRSRRIRPGFRS